MTSYSLIANFHKHSAFLTIRKNRKQKNPHISLLLLILSNDIHPNPGPKPPPQFNIIKCNTCKEDITDKYESLQCNTCENYYHVRCQKLSTQPITRNESFEWICSQKNCLPNYQKTYFHMHLISTNRYNHLNQNLADENIENPASIKLSPTELENVLLLKELSFISPEDYEGKCACRVCYKEVKDHHRAISCDVCENWSHLKCSDISIKLYNHLKYLHYFKWTCTKCRVTEQPVSETIDLNNLDLNGQPDAISLVKSLRNELVIINMNCRSIINKREELEHIIHETNADLIVLTETWMDESVPRQALVPDGYKILRKDRCPEFKQKYGRNRGRE